MTVAPEWRFAKEVFQWVELFGPVVREERSNELGAPGAKDGWTPWILIGVARRGFEGRFRRWPMPEGDLALLALISELEQKGGALCASKSCRSLSRPISVRA